MSHLRSITIVALIATVAVAAITRADKSEIDYPADFQGWHHVKSLVLLPGHPLEDPFGGIHHVYANDKARSGLEQGGYADGSVFVFDLFDAVEADHAVAEGPRKLVGVMEKNSRRFAKTGGWGFEGFAGNSQTERLVTDGGQSCFACHLSQKEFEYVFTKPRK